MFAQNLQAPAPRRRARRRAPSARSRRPKRDRARRKSPRPWRNRRYPDKLAAPSRADRFWALAWDGRAFSGSTPLSFRSPCPIGFRIVADWPGRFGPAFLKARFKIRNICGLILYVALSLRLIGARIFGFSMIFQRLRISVASAVKSAANASSSALERLRA